MSFLYYLHKTHFWSPNKREVFSTKKQCSMTPAAHPTIKLNSDTIYPDMTSDSPGKGSVLEDCPHSFGYHSEAQIVLTHLLHVEGSDDPLLGLQSTIQSPGCHLYFWPAINHRFPWHPSQVWIIWKRSPQNSQKQFSYIYHFTIKDDRGKWWKSRWKRCVGQGMWNGVRNCPGLSWCASPAAPPCVQQARSSLNAATLGLLWRLHHIGMIDHWLHIQPFTLPKRMGAGLKIPILIIAWSVQWPALMQRPTQSHLIRAKDTSITQEMTRGSRGLCQEPGGRDQYIYFWLQVTVSHPGYPHLQIKEMQEVSSNILNQQLEKKKRIIREIETMQMPGNQDILLKDYVRSLNFSFQAASRPSISVWLLNPCYPT